MAEVDPTSVPDRAGGHGRRIAIVDASGTYSYADLLDASGRVATALLSGGNDLEEERIAFRMTPGFHWVATQWGIWRAGGIAVPLALEAPASELDYYLENSQASALIYDESGESLMSAVAASRRIRGNLYSRLISCEKSRLPKVIADRLAMILYTSGTTSRPKGVVTTHANIAAQITALVEAWEWSADDRILLCLPLHHVHGIVNVLGCALWSGAVCEMLPRFDANAVWERIGSGSLTLFMAVPTIYVRLIAAWEAASPEQRTQWREGAARMRLMVSGSAALPVSTLQRWKEITGHTLLERYGMTEIGMALSNPYRGERVPGSVGKPLPESRCGWSPRAAKSCRPGQRARLKFADPMYSLSIGRTRLRPAKLFAMAGFAPETPRLSRTVFTEFWDEAASTSSRAAVIRFRHWRLKRYCERIRLLQSVPLWACRMRSGENAWPQPLSCGRAWRWTWRRYEPGASRRCPRTRCRRDC